MLRCYVGGNKILHATSSGEREVSIPKGKNQYAEFIAYVEKYINEHGFIIKFFDKEPNFFYFLLEKGD